MTVFHRRTVLAASLAFALNIAGSSIAAELRVAAAPQLSAIEAARSNPGVLLLRSGVFDPQAQQLDFAGVGAAEPAGSRYVIVQFHVGQTAAAKAFEKRGLRVLGYVPNNAFYVDRGGLSVAELAADPAVRWVGAVQPAMKLAPELWRTQRKASVARNDAGDYLLQIDLFDRVPLDNVVAKLRKHAPAARVLEAVNRSLGTSYLRVSVDADALDGLIEAATAIEGVEFVSPWQQPELMNSGAIGAIQGNATGACGGSGAVCGPAPLWDQGIFGTGQIVSVADSGADANEAWFTVLDKGNGPVTAITVADNPAPVPPGLGTLHPDNKIIGYWVQPGATAYDNNLRCTPTSPSTGWHGTHVSGTVLGDAAGTFGSSTYLASTPWAANHDLADGMAPNAQLLMQDIGNDTSGCLSISDFAGTLSQAAAARALVHNNSWGAPSFGAYGGNDIDVDRSTWAHEDLLVVISAGNNGDASPTSGSPRCPAAQYIGGVCTQSTGSPGNAKNALTVGALLHAGDIGVIGFSSRGPTADGRQKPDIMAPGTNTVSASGDSTTNGTIEAPLSKPLSGTSMASPTIAGNAALVRQFFADGFYPRGTRNAADTYDASGMVMKAVLLNGTNVLQPTTWPNRDIGWGRAWLDGNLWFANTMPGGDDSRRLRLFERTNASGLETGEVAEYSIANVAAGKELRATLTWFDPEGSIGAATTLVNNVDLEVVAPDGTLYLGNVFTAGVSTAGGVADAKNTVEQVRLTTPLAGRYVFRVRGTSVPGNGRALTDRQGYALAVSAGFGLPNPAPLPAPIALTVTANGASGVQIGFTAASGAQGFQLYRANGSCATAAAGNFRLAAQAAAAPLIDLKTQGGLGYAYKVRAIGGDVEGELSSCIDVVSAADCSLLPEFDTQSLVADAANETCGVSLSWQAAQLTCLSSSGITYKVERDTDPYFSQPTTIAAAISSASYEDTSVTDGTRYSYRVTAMDGFGNTAPLSRVVTATPSGAGGPDPAAFLDDVDTHSYMQTETPWQITHTTANDGTLSYHAGADGSNYPDNTCASIMTPSLTLPPAAKLSFAAKYNLEFEWDGVVQEISTDDGATWSELVPDGGYPSSFAQTTPGTPNNACRFLPTRKAFSGVSTAASNADPANATAVAVFKPFSANLAGYAGQTVKIRWRFSSDGADGYAGFHLDSVKIGTDAGFDTVFKNGFETSAANAYICH